MDDHSTSTAIVKNYNEARCTVIDTPELSTILAPYAPGYVLVRRVGETYQDRRGNTHTATGKEPKIGAWQRKPATLADAHKHAKRGGNVGLLGGHGGLILVDIDHDRAGALELWPQLAQTVEVYRETAPDRAKFILHVSGDLPASIKDHTSGTEILAAGSQGVIFGTHHTGAPILHRGASILTVSAAQVADFWHKRTSIEAPTPITVSAAAPDAAAVGHSMGIVAAVLDRLGLPFENWQPFDGTGSKIELEHCPFCDEDHPHQTYDGQACILVGANGRIGATCLKASCQERIRAAGMGGWRLLKAIAGYTATTDAPDAPDAPQEWTDFQAHSAVIDGLREWVRRADFAEFVPVMLQAENGYRTRGTDKRVAESILDIAQSAGRTSNLVFGVRKLRGLSGVGSTSTVAAALDRLSGWFVIRTSVDDPGSDPDSPLAQRWTIAPELVKSSCVDRTLIADQPTNAQGCSIYATSPFATDRARDAFIAAQTPMTRTELNERIEARNAEREQLKAAGVDPSNLPPRIKPRRYRRRLNATLPSAGTDVLLVIDALATDGIELDRATLRKLTHMSKHTLSRAVARGCELGLLETDGRHTVGLAPDWREKVDRQEPCMPTAGLTLERAISDIDAGQRWLDKHLEAPDLPDDERKRLERRRAALSVKKRALIERRYGVGVSAEVASTPAPYTNGHSDTLQTQAQVIEASKPKQTLSETERFLLDRFGSDASADEVSARWARFNSQMAAEYGSGWWANMSVPEIGLEHAAWAAQGYGVAA